MILIGPRPFELRIVDRFCWWPLTLDRGQRLYTFWLTRVRLVRWWIPGDAWITGHWEIRGFVLPGEPDPELHVEEPTPPHGPPPNVRMRA